MLQDKIIIYFSCADNVKRKNTQDLLQQLFAANVTSDGLSTMFAETVKFEKTSAGSFFFCKDETTFEVHLIPNRDRMNIPDYLFNTAEISLISFFDFLLYLGLCAQIVTHFFEKGWDDSSEIYWCRLNHGCVQVLNNRLYHYAISYNDRENWSENALIRVEDVLQKTLQFNAPDGYAAMYEKHFCKEWEIQKKNFHRDSQWIVSPASGQIVAVK